MSGSLLAAFSSGLLGAAQGAIKSTPVAGAALGFAQGFLGPPVPAQAAALTASPAAAAAPKGARTHTQGKRRAPSGFHEVRYYGSKRKSAGSRKRPMPAALKKYWATHRRGK